MLNIHTPEICIYNEQPADIRGYVGTLKQMTVCRIIVATACSLVHTKLSAGIAAYCSQFLLERYSYLFFKLKLRLGQDAEGGADRKNAVNDSMC